MMFVAFRTKPEAVESQWEFQMGPDISLCCFYAGADMNEGQLMGDFEMDSKQLEAESWSQVVDSKFLRQQKKDVVKRQDVIYGEMCIG